MSTGIDFVIGGKDKARPAMASVEKSLTQIQKKTETLSDSTSRLTKLTGGLVAAYAAVKSAMAVIGGVQALNAAYDQQAEAVKGLETALRLAGVESKDYSENLQAIASDLQTLTGVGDEVTLGLMKQASMMGMHTDQLDDAARAAIGLSEATGKDLSASMDMIRLATEGNFAAFGKLIPEIKSAQTEEEKLAIMMELASKGLESKIESSNRLAGISERASGAIGDLMESVGALLAPIRVVINVGLKTMAEVLQQILSPAVERSNDLMEKMGEWATWLRDKIVEAVNKMIAAFTFLEVMLRNLDSVWEYLVASAEASLHALAGSVKHYLTEVIPSYAIWLKDNLPALLKAAITGGDAEIQQLPQIAERQMSAREAALRDKMAAIGDKLGSAFAEKYAERMIVLTDTIEGISKEISLKLGKDIEESSLKKSTTDATLQATQGRLLTRGQSSEDPGKETNRLLKGVKQQLNALVGVNEEQKDVQEEIVAELGNTVRMVPVV